MTLSNTLKNTTFQDTADTCGSNQTPSFPLHLDGGFLTGQVDILDAGARKPGSPDNMDGTEPCSSLKKQIALIQAATKSLEDREISGTPVFTELVRQHGNSTSSSGEEVFTQYGLLGGDVAKLRGAEDREAVPDAQGDPRVFYNIRAPSSVFICGSQGSGKSHTLSCLLENCLIPTEANTLPRPLTGIVFHYDPFFSDNRGQRCEAASISSHAGVKVRVLCPPTNVQQIKRLYETLPNVEVQELRISQRDLNTKRMLDLMAVSSIQEGTMPLYLHIVTRILRDLRIEQQKNGGFFNYRAFRRAIAAEGLTPGQSAPLKQRLDTLESFMAREDVAESKIPCRGSCDPWGDKSHLCLDELENTASAWEPKAGQLTIVDLSCPCVTAESACSLFNICLSLFLEQHSSDMGRVIALDEAHKYMTESAESQSLTESLVSTIRLQRHLGARIVIATQEPTISPTLLDLCTVTIVHRFTSPSWLESLRKHLAGASLSEKKTKAGEDESGGSSAASLAGLLGRIISLRQGEALMFCPSAIVGVRKAKQDDTINGLADDLATWSLGQDPPVSHVDPGSGLIHLGQGVMKIRVRERITEDGGRSIMAA
ncbi:uncharacterized protein MAM_03057 [Metarhizium album ARSEF 1941]|uniref:P-loop containing nucleoside triphosphate hydrolase n=1 Tax=Metarhizium album (strain ARSEF 1941) TaxID=1081103 RepID=A0A0B2X0I8_METAS|nr:uncharacterized protein MAM_03057 [Metarhizium album ARSEF 1941]KHN99359.1 hypothetical protein MAM_03057 [Metarhizium album ARSEF 1941]